jgi:hypothetical protein
MQYVQYRAIFAPETSYAAYYMEVLGKTYPALTGRIFSLRKAEPMDS